MRDLYSVLGVKRDAGAEEIKAAWRSKAKSVHPDQNRDDPNANKRFAEIGRAYEVLKDPAKRTKYDEQRSKVEALEREQTIMQQRQAAREAAERAKIAKANAERVMEELARAEAEKAKAERAASEKAAAAEAKAAKAAGGPEQKPTAGEQGPASADGPEEMVSRIFGESAEAQAAAEALRRDTDAARNEAEAGEQDDARASAAPRSLAPLDILSFLVRRIRGIQPAPEKAPDLTVEAAVAIEDLINRNTITVTLSDGRELRVPLHDGVTDGSVVRLKGQGLRLPGMQRGDVVTTIRSLKSERFRVDGHDIRTTLPITLENAVLGCETTVETPGGVMPLTIPPWSNSDQVFTLEGEGLGDGNGGRGALMVELRVMLWDKPDDKVTDLMRVMREGLYL